MQEIVANVDHITFSIEKMLEQQTGAQALIFPGMDSKWYDDVVEGGGLSSVARYLKLERRQRYRLG